MKLRFLLLISLIIFTSNISYSQKIKVVTSTPDLKDMVENICGGDVEVETLMRGTENHHAVPLKPSFLVKLSRCDVLVVNGFEYEHAFIPVPCLPLTNPTFREGLPIASIAASISNPAKCPQK